MLDVRGVIDRRILVNYRVRRDALAAVLPASFEPMTIDGWGVGGVCLIRLRDVRPRRFPAVVGVGSENAAHRIAVTWDDGAETKTGVYVPRRDTSSRLNAAFGGYLFGGGYGHARFDVGESGNEYDVSMESDDGETRVAVRGRVADSLPEDSVFDSLEAASEFFRRGSTGYAPVGSGTDTAADRDSGSGTDTRARSYRGVELVTDEWQVEPLAVESAASSYFESSERFPPDAVAFDDALLMRDIAHEWRRRESLCAPAVAGESGDPVAGD
jgi:hypothetical protein